LRNNLNLFILKPTLGDSHGIADLLLFSSRKSASDLHVSAHMPPMIRLNGDIRKLSVPPLGEKEVHDMLYDIMNDRQRKVFENSLEVDFSFDIQNLGRFSCQCFSSITGYCRRL